MVEGECNRTPHTHFTQDYFILYFRITFCILSFLFGELPRKSSTIRCVSTEFVVEHHMHLLQGTGGHQVARVQTAGRCEGVEPLDLSVNWPRSVVGVKGVPKAMTCGGHGGGSIRRYDWPLPIAAMAAAVGFLRPRR
jgi:hypothetical protein